MQVPISQLTGAVILNPVPRPDVVVVPTAASEASFDDARARRPHSPPTAPNGPANGATSTAAEEPLPNSEKLEPKSGKIALPELPPPPPPAPPPPPLPPTRRHCQKYYFGGGEGELQRGRGFSNIVESKEIISSPKRCSIHESDHFMSRASFRSGKSPQKDAIPQDSCCCSDL